MHDYEKKNNNKENEKWCIEEEKNPRGVVNFLYDLPNLPYIYHLLTTPTPQHWLANPIWVKVVKAHPNLHLTNPQVSTTPNFSNQFTSTLNNFT